MLKTSMYSLLAFLLTMATGFSKDCNKPDPLDFGPSVNHLTKLAQVTETNSNLLDIKISYGIGPIAKKVGKAVLNLNAKGEVIQVAKVSGGVGLFGMNAPLQMSFSGEDFIKGEPIEIKVAPGADSIVVLKAAPGFKHNGGLVDISFREKDGKMKNIRLHMQYKDGRHRLYEKKEGVLKAIDSIEIKVQGVTLEGLYIANTNLYGF